LDPAVILYRREWKTLHSDSPKISKPESAGAHQSVLLAEAISSLNVRPGGTYIDGTYGRGGHSKEILKRLQGSGLLLAFDKDPEAVRHGEQFINPCFSIIHSSFSAVQEVLDERGISKVDGCLIDLGVSSPQLDDASRGFSFQKDGPLDMRMDTEHGLSAAQWLANATEEEISRVVYLFGEERHAKKIARAICKFRESNSLNRTSQLAEIVRSAIPSQNNLKKNPATKTFQAIRILVNGELEELDMFLRLILGIMRKGARLAVISFHSLEDRLVKQFLREKSSSNMPSKIPLRQADIPVGVLKVVGKPIKPSEDEINKNPRARSAVLRVAEMMQ
jgi:16S rRNA (cytosine1402-N4)-methyltransferase